MTGFDTSKQRRLGGKTLIALAGIVSSWAVPTYADTAVWNNFNGTNGWMTGGNWLPAVQPVRSVDLVIQFTSQSTNYGSTNNYSGADWTLNQFVFEGNGAGNVTITTSNVPLAFSTSSGGVAPSIVQNSAGSFLVQGNGGIRLSSGDLYLKGNGGGIVTMKSIISGNNGLFVDGNATFALTGAHTYSGGTTVNSGTLQLGIGTGSAIGVGALNFNGGRVSASGPNAPSPATPPTYANVINVGADKSVTFGDSNTAYNGDLIFSGAANIGQNSVVRVDSALTLSNAAGPALQSNVTFEIANTGKLTLAKLDVTNDVTLSLVLGTPSLAITNALTGNTGDLNFILNGSVSGGVYTLLNFTNTDLSYSNLHLVGGVYSLDTTFGQDGWLINGNSLQVKVVPEPSTWAMALLGLGALVLMGHRARLKVRS